MTPDITNKENEKTLSQKMRTKSKIFSNLSRFYTSDVILENGSNVLVSLVEDFVNRKGYGLDNIVEDLTTFCDGGHDDSLQCRVFVHSVLSFIQTKRNTCEASANCVRDLLRLLWKFSGTFSDVFSEIASKNTVECLSSGINSEAYGRLHYFLKHGQTLDVTSDDGENLVRFIDAPLEYGASPLMLASCNRHPEAVLLLLRHGANVSIPWLNFKSSLEGLLFAPNQLFISNEDLEKIQKCFEYHLRAMSWINVPRMQSLTQDGYTVLLPEWKTFVPCTYYHSPGSLKHLTRCKIREILNEKRQLPAGIGTLPLPPLMKSYIDLQESH